MTTKPRQWQPSFNGTLGLKQGYAITNMPPGSCLDIKNMYLNGLGGKTCRNGYDEIFHTTEDRLYAGTVTGTPAVEATLLQATSAATARVKGVGSGYFVVESVTGTFDSSHVVTGTNPAGTTFTFTPTVVLLVEGIRLTNRVRSLIQYKPFAASVEGTHQVLAYAGTEIFRQDSTTTNSIVVRGGLTSDIPWEWLQYRNLVLGVNGTDGSFLYSSSSTVISGWGRDSVTISITAPAAHVTATIGAGGTLPVEDYTYLMTFYDTNTTRESNPYTLSTAPSVTSAGSPGNATANLSAFPAITVGEGVTHRRIYRKSSTETLYYRIGEITAATTTFADTGLAATTLYLEYDTGQPDEGNTPHPNSKLIAEQFDRIFMVDPTDPSILVYSKVGDYWAFPSGNFSYVGRGDGSRIRRIEKHGKALLIHKGAGWYILDGDPVTTDVKFISKIGTQDFRTSVSAHNQVVRLTPVGFYRSIPTDYDTADLREDYIGNDVADYESGLDYSNSSLATMFNYNASNRRHVYYIEPVSASFYSKCLVFDIVSSQWVYYEIGADVFSAAQYMSDSKEYMMMGDGYGIIWQWDVGSSDGHGLSNTITNGTATSATATTLSDTSVVDVSSTITAGSGAATLVDSSKSWTVDQWVDYQVYNKTTGDYGTVLSNTANTLTMTTNWSLGAPSDGDTYHIGGWTVNELTGVVVKTWTGTGLLQRRRILSNISDTITVATWSTTPDSTTTYTIGGIDKYADEYWDSNGDPHLLKRMRWVVPYIRQTGSYNITLSARKDFTTTYYKTGEIALTSSSSLWNSMIWNTGSWSGSTSNLERFRINGKYHYYSIRYQNYNSGEPFYWDGHGAVFQILHDRNR